MYSLNEFQHKTYGLIGRLMKLPIFSFGYDRLLFSTDLEHHLTKALLRNAKLYTEFVYILR